MSKQIEYIDTGVNWLGQIPSTWESKRIKMLTRVKRGASPRPIDNPIYFEEEGEFAWVRIADVTASERYLESTTQRLSELGSSLSVKRYPDDFFLSIAGTVGKPIITKIKCCIHDGFVYFPDLKINPEFLYYIFSTGLPYLGLGKLGTQLNLNTDTVGDIYIPIPDEQEIEKIVSYLDERTEEIDNLISKKQKLIDCLKEERMAIINQAVTKGINPNAEMKDSNVEWLGRIPKVWTVKKLKYVLNFLDYKRVPLSSDERGKMTDKTYDYYGASGVIDKVEDYIFDGTYILLGEDGANLITRSTELAFIATGKFWVNNHAHILEPKNGNIFYYKHILECYDYSPIISGSAQPKLTAENLANIEILEPPKADQNLIIDFLNSRSMEINNVIKKIEKEIELIKEYRTSLINEVVTGKKKLV